MSLAIDMNQITGILLADGWHDVQPGNFTIDAFEFVYDAPNFEGKMETIEEYSGGAGAMWLIRGHNDEWICCPIASILAVRTTRKKRKLQ